MLHTNLPKSFSTDTEVRCLIHTCRSCGFQTTDARDAFRHRRDCAIPNPTIDVHPLTLEDFKRS